MREIRSRSELLLTRGGDADDARLVGVLEGEAVGIDTHEVDML